MTPGTAAAAPARAADPRLPGGLSIPQTVIACAGMTCATVLCITGHVSGDAVVALVSAISGGALGYVNGKKAGAR